MLPPSMQQQDYRSSALQQLSKSVAVDPRVCGFMCVRVRTCVCECVSNMSPNLCVWLCVCECVSSMSPNLCVWLCVSVYVCVCV
jgi:hypothetical protein